MDTDITAVKAEAEGGWEEGSMEDVCYCNSGNNKEIYTSGPGKVWER